MSVAGLRIVLVGPVAPPPGGMANQLAALAALLDGDGAAVTVVPTNGRYAPRWLEHVRGVRAAARLMPYCHALWRAARDCDVMHVLANSGWSWHLFAAPALQVARLRGVPCVIHYHGGGAEAFLARAGAHVLAALRAADALIVPSRFLQEVFARRGIDARVVPNVVDLGRLARRAPSRAPGAHLVVTRNLEPVYDIPTALRAFARVRAELPAATLSIAGRGPEAPRLQSLAHELGVAGAVTFTGGLDADGIAALLARADVLLNPSTADNMPVSILEAMAAGVPVVSTRAGGIPYLVRDGDNGLLVDVGDAEAMARAVLEILGNAALRDALVERAGAEVEGCSQPRVLAALARTYATIGARAERARSAA